MKDLIFDSTVLLVDDQEAILEGLQEIVSEDVSRVLVSANPLKALELARKNPVDLVVVDLKMPEMTGLELIAEMRKINPYAHFIVLSGFGEMEDVREAMRMGVENFIDKPFDPDYVRLSVKRVLEKVGYERLIREMLELFVLHYAKIDIEALEKMSIQEKEKTLRAAMGVARLQILKKNVKP